MLASITISSALKLLKPRNTSLIRSQCYATRKRFYRSTSVIQNEGKWEITLDHRKLKTPNGKPLLVESEPLARAIAAEWDAQTEVISPPTMHLTALCNTAIDNPGNLNQHDITNYLLDYISTDTLLFQSEDESELQALQEEKWSPILQWFEHRFGVSQPVSRGLTLPPVAAATRAVLARHYLSYSLPALTAIVFGVEALKSPILMLACVERRLDARDAVLLARLEEEYQSSRWGRVPWAHSVSQAELTARVAAALLRALGAGEARALLHKAAPHAPADP